MRGTIEGGDIVPMGFDIKDSSNWVMEKLQHKLSMQPKEGTPWPDMHEINTDPKWIQKHTDFDLPQWHRQLNQIAVEQ